MSNKSLGMIVIFDFSRQIILRPKFELIIIE